MRYPVAHSLQTLLPSWRTVRRLALQTLAALFLLSVTWVLLYRWVPPPATALMLERRAHVPVASPGEPPYLGILPAPRHIRYQFTTLDEVAPDLPLAVVAAEDQRFLLHRGFDVDGIWQAAKYNWNRAEGMPVRGGSTISQQVAKNVFLWPGRSYVRKAAEAYFTLLIEVLWSKRRIMEMYLSVAELGDCTFGVEAASQHYFHKPARALTEKQAALLAGVLPNPLRFRADDRSGETTRKQARVLYKMGRLGGLNYVKKLRK